jgi:hypothetical protein
VSGDISISAGSTVSTLTATGVVAGTYQSATQLRNFTVDAKGRITSAGSDILITPAWSSITSKPTTLAGYGISLTKNDVGLGNVDNTSDATKNSATATLTNKTIDLSNNTFVATSAQLAASITDETGTGSLVFSTSPALTGVPTAPTATVGTNTAQLATTAFIKSEKDAILSRGNNLVANGNGILGTLYNWNNVTGIYADVPVGAKQAFRSIGSGTQNNNSTSEFIPVNPNKKYYSSIAFKQLNAGVLARAYMYIAPYDGAGLSIQPTNYMEQANTRTTLALPLNNGDTTITLTSAANWWNSTSDHRSSIIFWNWTDSFGKTWPPGTYSRYYWAAGLWAAGGISGNVITLKSPWVGGNFAAGHIVGNGSSGASYLYPITPYPVPESWTTYVGTLTGGVHTDLTSAATTGLPISTASVVIGTLTDYNATGGTSQIIFSNVYFSDVFTHTIDQLEPVSKTANTFYAAPNAAAGQPSFRTIVAADIPTLNQNTAGYSGAVLVADTRSVASTPQSFSNRIQADFKANTTDGLNDGGMYHGVLTLRQYASGSDWSGGGVRQVGFTDNHNLWVRGANADTTWSTWKQLAFTSSDITGNAASATTAVRLTNLTSTTSSNAGLDNTESCVSYISGISLLGQVDGALYSHVYSSSWKHNIYGDYRTGQIAVRGKNNGTWQPWRTVLDSVNVSSYAQAPLVSGTNIKTINGVSILGSGNVTISGAGGGITYTKKIANYTAADKDGILADTSAGAFTVTLPSSPTVGMQVWIADGSSWALNSLTIAPSTGA